jgi:hypothetical protein
MAEPILECRMGLAHDCYFSLRIQRRMTPDEWRKFEQIIALLRDSVVYADDPPPPTPATGDAP